MSLWHFAIEQQPEDLLQVQSKWTAELELQSLQADTQNRDSRPLYYETQACD